MKDIYGIDFMEAHHLHPVSELKGKVVELNPIKDFAVLSPNCHTAIHKSGDPSNVVALRDAMQSF